MAMLRWGRKRLAIGAVAIAVVVVVAVVLGFALGSKKSIDDTEVGGTITGDRLHSVLGHLFDGVSTVHVKYVPNSGPAAGAADVILGPPVQAKIALTTTTTPPQTGSVIIKDNKAYFTTASLGSKWVIMSSADDGISGAPALGQTAFELSYLGPTTVATYKGPASIDGISTREYVLTSTASSASASPTGTPQVVATVWIDTNGRLIQYSYSPTGDGTWVTATYSNWGESVTVQAPPSQDITVAQGAM